ncbi:transporter [Paraburkholderia silvatlantica]|uniref:transporter n=1 Tax=Paraburkholderia silvatlantica TaxID=321895 RepID=UPI0037517D29
MKLFGKQKILRSVFRAVVLLPLAFSEQAFAVTFTPYATYVLPPSIDNMAILYNFSTYANTYVTPSGTSENNTRVSNNVSLLRYFRSFSVAGMPGAFQYFQPYVGWLGNQRIGGETLPSHNGFGQPTLNLNIWPYVNENTGTTVVLGVNLSPPVSSYNSRYTLNPGAPPAWSEGILVGGHTTLFGNARTRNLVLEALSLTTFYQNSDTFLASTPRGPMSAVYHEKTSQELDFFLTYTFAPAKLSSVSVGYSKTFGGSQTITIPGLAQLGVSSTVDTGNRTDESTLILSANTFVTRSVFLSAYGYSDLSARGGTKNRTLGVAAGFMF